jgi:hypothetical protein
LLCVVTIDWGAIFTGTPVKLNIEQCVVFVQHVQTNLQGEAFVSKETLYLILRLTYSVRKNEPTKILKVSRQEKAGFWNILIPIVVQMMMYMECYFNVLGLCTLDLRGIIALCFAHDLR